jgi:hypothetical protein
MSEEDVVNLLALLPLMAVGAGAILMLVADFFIRK